MVKRKAGGNLPQSETIMGLARLLKADRETIRRVLDGIDPVGKDPRGKEKYPLEAVSQALEKRRASSAQPPGHGRIGTGDAAELRILKLTEQHRQLKIANDLRESKLMATDKIRARDAAICANWNTLRSRIEAEWPLRFVGLSDPAQIREVIREMMTALGREFSKLDTWVDVIK